MKIQKDTHINELGVEKKKINIALEETRASTCIMESIKVEVVELSEKLATEMNELLDLISIIRYQR
jgi:hypothetical protein